MILRNVSTFNSLWLSGAIWRHGSGIGYHQAVTPDSTGVGVTKAPFVNFSVSKMLLSKYLLDYLHHIHIWQVSPQLSCGNTCQIWTWYTIASMYFGDAEKLGKRRNGGNWLSNSNPWFIVDWDIRKMLSEILIESQHFCARKRIWKWRSQHGNHFLQCIHSVWPRSGSALAQVMAFCLMAPTHFKSNFTASIQVTILYDEFENYTCTKNFVLPHSTDVVLTLRSYVFNADNNPFRMHKVKRYRRIRYKASRSAFELESMFECHKSTTVQNFYVDYGYNHMLIILLCHWFIDQMWPRQ